MAGLSRPKRLAKLTAAAQEQIADLMQTLEELIELRGEYQEWRDNLPENLETSPIVEKLDAIIEIDLDGAVSNLEEVDNAVQEFADADLPLGFGRD